MKTRNSFLHTRRIGAYAACLLMLGTFTGCGQPAQDTAASEPEMETNAAPVAAPAQAVETPAAQTLSSEEAAQKATVLDAISVVESTVDAAEQSQADRQAIMDAAAEQTDAQLQQAAEAAEAEGTERP